MTESATIRKMYNRMIASWIVNPERRKRTMLVLSAEIERNYLLTEKDKARLVSRIMSLLSTHHWTE